MLETLNQNRSVVGLSRTAALDGDTWVFGADEQEYNELKENFVNYRLFEPRGIGRFLSTRTAKSYQQLDIEPGRTYKALIR